MKIEKVVYQSWQCKKLFSCGIFTPNILGKELIHHVIHKNPIMKSSYKNILTSFKIDSNAFSGVSSILTIYCKDHVTRRDFMKKNL